MSNKNSNFNHLKLSAAIAHSGMTQNKIADLLGVHYNTVSGYANGRSPHPDKLYEFLIVLGWDAEQLKRERLTDWYHLNEATTAASPTEG